MTKLVGPIASEFSEDYPMAWGDYKLDPKTFGPSWPENFQKFHWDFGKIPVHDNKIPKISVEIIWKIRYFRQFAARNIV